MTGLSWTFAVVAGLAHVGAFVMESFLFHRHDVQRLMIGRVDPAPGVRLWAFNQGFYNLFLALGAFTGAVTWAVADETVGRTLIVFSCAAMALAGIVLIVSDRRLWRGGIGQFLPPAIAVAAALAA